MSTSGGSGHKDGGHPLPLLVIVSGPPPRQDHVGSIPFPAVESALSRQRLPDFSKRQIRNRMLESAHEREGQDCSER